MIPAEKLNLADQQSAELAEYKPRTGLIKRGLEDVTRDSLSKPRIIQVPTDYASLQLAVDDANEGDIIEILQGEYEENVVIQKALTIRSPSGLALLRPQHPAEPLLLVDLEHGRLTVEDLTFQGKAGAFRKPQIGISIVNGEVIASKCEFFGWETSNDEFMNDEEMDWDEYWKQYERSDAITVSGTALYSWSGSADSQYAKTGLGCSVGQERVYMAASLTGS